ncbi:MAG: hypothetical protein JNM65_02440 [Verrucomicrobiaceae bacterium]|nr:hypothetical protein [Verrucomicrobiaceae bacterium]
MSTGRIVARIIIILGLAVLGASVGVCFQALRITGKPQEFRSLAKIVSARGMLGDKGDNTTSLADHYGTIIETLESAEIKRRALERVRALNPELKETDVEIRVAQTKGSAIFNILVTGREPKFTRIYLDALLDEFMAFRRQLQEQLGKTNGNLDVAIQERATTAYENVEDWVMPITVGVIGGGLAGGLPGLLLALLLVRQPQSA